MSTIQDPIPFETRNVMRNILEPLVSQCSRKATFVLAHAICNYMCYCVCVESWEELSSMAKKLSENMSRYTLCHISSRLTKLIRIWVLSLTPWVSVVW
jgi:hypothetical protein